MNSEEKVVKFEYLRCLELIWYELKSRFGKLDFLSPARFWSSHSSRLSPFFSLLLYSSLPKNKSKTQKITSKLALLLTKNINMSTLHIS